MESKPKAVKIVLCFVLLMFSIQGFPQTEYPPIEIDSSQLIRKKEFLDKITRITTDSKGPNIVLILADDLGKNDFSTYNSDEVCTPHLDQLATEGVRFTEAYSSCSVCSPSRASLLTGRYQQRFGYERQPMTRYARNPLEYFAFRWLVNTRPMYLRDPWYSPPEDEIRKQGLPKSELTLFEVLQRAGYTTACIGKWHLGYNEPFLPQNKGVDEFYGFYEAFTLFAPVQDKSIVNVRQNTFHNRHIWRQKRTGPSAIMRNDKVIDEKEYLTFSIADEACEFISKNGDQEFFLYVPFSAPHTPFQVPRSYYDRFSDIKDKNKRVYWAMISALDDAVGQILEEIKRSGIEDNTLVIFASDNGGATYTGATNNGDLKGGKFTQFEGGVNIPMIIKWAGHIEAGVDFDSPVSLMDIFPTVLSATSIESPSYSTFDGVNLMPYFNSLKTGKPHDYLFWRTDFNKAVRHQSYKLLVNTRDNYLMLYNLETDKSERFDLKDKHPDEVNNLLKAIEDWEKGLKPPAWPGVMEIERIIDGKGYRFAI